MWKPNDGLNLDIYKTVFLCQAKVQCSQLQNLHFPIDNSNENLTTLHHQDTSGYVSKLDMSPPMSIIEIYTSIDPTLPTMSPDKTSTKIDISF